MCSRASTRPAPVAERPPLVLVFVDQLRAEASGAAGNRFVRTPHLDRLARASVRFGTAVTNAPLCRPARFTLMTGQPVHQHRVSTNHRPPEPGGLPSHVRLVRDEAGYHTVVVGKTHLHGGQGHFDDHRERLRQWGFADAVELQDAQQHWVRSAHTDWLTRSTAPGARDKAARWRDYAAHYGWDTAPPDAEPWGLGLDDHLDSFCARTAAEVIRSYAATAERPLYLQVNFPGPHPPFDAPSAFSDVLDPGDPLLPHAILGPRRGPPSPAHEQYARHQRVRTEAWTEDRVRALRVRYYAKVALVDHAIGQVLDALRDARLYDRAWIVVTSDHGELLGDHGLTGKVLAFEPAIRVPLLVKPPGASDRDGWVDEGAVDLLDVVATLADIAGVARPGMGDRSLVGRVCAGPNGPEAHAGKTVLFENMGYTALRTDRWTLGWQLAYGRPVELFDREHDPDQRWNRVEDPDYAPVLAELVDALRAARPLTLDRHDGSV